MRFPHARAKVLRVLPSSLPRTSLLRAMYKSKISGIGQLLDILLLPLG